MAMVGDGFSPEVDAAFEEARKVRRQLDDIAFQGGPDGKPAKWWGCQYSNGDVPLQALTESFNAAQQIKTALGALGLVKDVNAVTLDLNKPFANSGWSVSAPLKQIDRAKLDKLSPSRQTGSSVS